MQAVLVTNALNRYIHPKDIPTASYNISIYDYAELECLLQ